MRTSLLGGILLLLAGVVSPAAAQAVVAPPGSIGGLFGGHHPTDPNRPSQRLTLTVDLSGGYDSDGDAAFDVPGGLVADEPAGTARAAVNYWRGRTSRFFESSASSFVNHRGIATGTIIGGEATARASTMIDSRSRLSGAGAVTYDPEALANPLAPGLGAGGDEIDLVTDLAPPQGLVEQRWLATAGFADVERAWTGRHMTNAQYRASQRRPIEGAGYRSNTQAVSVAHNWNARPSVSFVSSYRFDNNRQDDQTLSLPSLKTHSVDVGITLQRRFSPIRTLTVSIAGGVAHSAREASSDADAFGTAVPVVSASARMGLTRVWALSAQVGRQVSVLDGIAPQSFSSDAAALYLDAIVSRRISMRVSGNYSRGTGLEGAGDYDSSAGTAQLEYGIASCCGLFTNYSYYQHTLSEIATLPDGFPQRYKRHALRVGMTLWLPLFGSF